ncbi:MAG: Rho-binding antiterminator [Gammaproteobacteria bacterium]|nr:Rho-binding antiterminator [Gammaproteobacteria bacterium]MBL6999199.1 Rho-binding antiterminator [Gammaproteobacteria bacterium]
MISCALHDYIEIACLYHYRIKLQLRTGQSVDAKAISTETSADKKEYLLVDSGSQRQRIELSLIQSMQALSANPHFDIIHF